MLSKHGRNSSHDKFCSVYAIKSKPEIEALRLFQLCIHSFSRKKASKYHPKINAMAVRI